MATYFHGNSEIQPDGLQTLILMNPGYVGYSDAQQPGNFVFLNSAAGNSLSQANPPPTQQLVGIPLQAQTSGGTSSASQDPYHQSMHPQHHEISALHGFVPRGPYNLWNSVEPVARETPRAQQGLSLSLSSQQPGYGGSFRAERELPSQASAPTNGEDMRISAGSASSVSGISNGVSGIQSVLLSSKYLKAAQQLLDQVVNVGNGIKTDHVSRSTKMIGESSAAAIRDGSIDGETSARSGTDLSTAEKQEIRMKKAKLVTMLDEVEQRYRQYHHQMQIVISTFEQAAGIGSARTYTALALQTISKQFRCLKDAILGQIRAANKSLGEEDSLGGKMEGSKLKFVDHHLRQQRALQQLGMIQHSAWRPQRGLPERSVSVLRAWLFEHFLHPYPKDSDKHMLAKQTGLTRSQVSNWFINARVRLWKPMVEEMYLEELKDQDQNASPDKTNSKSEHNEDSVSKSSALQDKSPVRDNNRSISFKAKQDFPTNQNATAISTSTTSPIGGNHGNQSGFTLIGSQELDGFTQGSPKKQRSTKMLDFSNNVPSIDHMVVKHDEASNEHHSMKFGSIDQDHNRGGFSFMGGPTNFIEGFGSYPIGEIGRFDTEQFHQRFSGNGVSLTLGLPDCENLSLSGTHQSFLPNQSIHLGRRVEMGERTDFGAINTPTPSHTTTGYENISIQNGKRFAAQLLPDFVA